MMRCSNPEWLIPNLCIDTSTIPASAGLLFEIIDLAAEAKNVIYEEWVSFADMKWTELNDMTLLRNIPPNAIFLSKDAGLFVGDKLSSLLCVTRDSFKWQPLAEYCATIDVSSDQQLAREYVDYTSKLRSVQSAVEKHVSQLLASSSSTNILRRCQHHKLLQEIEEEEKLLAIESADYETLDTRYRDFLQETADVISNYHSLTAEVEALDEKMNELTLEREQTQFLFEARQLRLFYELGNTYPIEEVSEGEFAIRGLELPAFIDTSLKDDDSISSALGYVAHMLVLLSKYLQITLRYEIIYNASRSMIRDGVLGTGAPFPLYKRGSDRDRFDRAMSFLQKDIEQIMFFRGHTYDTTKTMLGNIRYLFDCETCPKLAT